MVLPFFGIFSLVSLLLLFFAKWSIACALFPFALSWILLTGFIGSIFPQAYVDWAVFSVFGFASAIAFSSKTGALLAAGTPRAGAMLKSLQKMIVPFAVGSLLFVCAVKVDMAHLDASGIASGAVEWISFVVWFFAFFFGSAAFAPWDRLRSSSRKVEISSKKPSKKK